MPCANSHSSHTHKSGLGSTSARVESPQPHDAAGGALLTKGAGNGPRCASRDFFLVSRARRGHPPAQRTVQAACQ
jgi:hypothetical protein